VTGYKVYRGSAAGGPYTLLRSLGAVTSYTDNTVVSGQTYYYVVTAVGTSAESPYSNQAQAVIMVP
jgi:fibronectin type 3 domain-containing protein